MYIQREAINVQVLYDLAIDRKDVWADKLYNTAWGLYRESKIVDLSKVKVIYTDDDRESKYCSYSELPEEIKQLTALCICLIGRWLDELNRGDDCIWKRYKLNCKPTDFWHGVGIFENDYIMCRNMEQLIEKISHKK